MLEFLLQSLHTVQEQGSEISFEVIVVDGGSKDPSLAVASKYTDLVLSTSKGRALQQNIGAENAKGDYFWFLHADSKFDTALIQNYFSVIIASGWGRFAVKLSGKSYIFRVIEWFMNKRSCLSAIATGDQGIFVRADLFKKVGGFPAQALMEDIEISKRLKKMAKMNCANTPRIITSSRKWQQEGILKTIFLMWYLRFLYFIGTSPDRLAEKYYK